MVFPSKSPADDFEQRISARELRLIAVVEAYLRQLRSGGAVDPETHLREFEELRQDLEPLLHAVLRLEASALWIRKPWVRRGRQWDEQPRGGGEGGVGNGGGAPS